MKYILSLITGLVLLAQAAVAGNYAYVYIEGDKQTPFYVKVEGQMMPRLGKNYCIIPNLAAGVTNIEILFQQNSYPVQKFAILIPEAGSRGFVLQKVNDRQFALYDLQQGSYLVSGNKPEDDKLPVAAASSGSSPVEQAPPVTAAVSNDGSDIPAFRPAKKTKQKTEKKTAEEPAAEDKQQETGKEDGRFIGNMELNPDPGSVAGTDPAGAAVVPEKKKKKNKKEAPETSLAAINDEGELSAAAKEDATTDVTSIPNTDCKTPMSSEEFENFALKILDKTDDDARIKVLAKNKGRQCFTTEQVRIIANNLETQSGRYDVVKMLYSQTSDQSNYPELESLFKTNYLKGKFREILHPQEK